jgi:imidazolonepropionase
LFDNARVYPIIGDTSADYSRCFAVTDGRISAIDEQVPARRSIDLGGRLVLPGLVDCHTHLVYAGDRMAEHTMRLAGATYEEIARAGGGILSTVEDVRAADEAMLVEASLPRVDALLAEGVTTIEIKSGYGLDTAGELKMLRAIRELDCRSPARIHATFLGAHAVPRGRDRADYLREVTDEMLPAVAAESLADTVDMFVESVGFDLDELRRLADAAQHHGLRLRVHAEQLSAMGASGAAAALGALSCDHLEYAQPADIDAMAAAGCVAVLLPGAFYFLRETQKPPVARLRAAGVPMAVASDMNPGSSPVASLLTSAHMSCLLFGLSAAEALAGITVHAARAMGLEDEAGRIATGRPADFSVWDLPGAEFLVYQLGGLRPDAVYIDGERV